jgi:hypothetical protein
MGFSSTGSGDLKNLEASSFSVTDILGGLVAFLNPISIKSERCAKVLINKMIEQPVEVNCCVH